MFPDSQIAQCYTFNETKMKYAIQFGIASYFRDLLKIDFKNIPYSFKVDETTEQQGKKQYNGYIPYWSVKFQFINIACHGTLMVDHCPAEKLLDHFFEFFRKANLHLHLMLHTGMDGPNVNLKFEELLRPSESFKHLILYFCLLVPGHSILPITGLNLVSQSEILMLIPLPLSLIFFFKLSTSRRADYIGMGSLTEFVSHFLPRNL